jgi:hypothetical protein
MTIYTRKMNRKEVINLAEEFVREKIAAFDGGHDWWYADNLDPKTPLLS